MERQAGALTKRKRLDFLWLSWLIEVIITEKSLLMPQQQLGQHGPGQQRPVCCRVFYGESPFLLARGRCAPEMQDRSRFLSNPKAVPAVDLRTSNTDIYSAGAGALRPPPRSAEGLRAELGCSVAPGGKGVPKARGDARGGSG